MQMSMLDVPEFMPYGFGSCSQLLNEELIGPDPFGLIDGVYWEKVDRLYPPKKVLITVRQKRLPGGWFTQTQRRISRHPVVSNFKPGWLIEDGKIKKRISTINPVIHIKEAGRLVAVLGFFVDTSYRDSIVPVDSQLQSSLLHEESRLAIFKLLAELALSLPNHLIPVPIVRIDQKDWSLRKDRVWLEVPVQARLVVPMTVGQGALVEWLTEQISIRQSQAFKASSIWTTRRIAQRVGKWTQGLKVIEWKSRLPPRLDAVVSLFEHFQPMLSLEYFPRFLPNSTGAHAFCANIREMEEGDRLRWRSILGQLDGIQVDSLGRPFLCSTTLIFSKQILTSSPELMRWGEGRLLARCWLGQWE